MTALQSTAEGAGAAASTVWDLVLPVTGETLLTATAMILGYLAVMFLAARFLPGLERRGYELPDGTRKLYHLTGMSMWYWVHIVLIVGFLGFGVTLTPLITHFWSLFIVMNVVAAAWTLGLYVWGRRKGDVLRADTGDDVPLPAAVRDLWFGNELNPTWFGVDIKMFMYQPSLIGTYLFVLGFASAQWELYGTLTPQMLMLVAFWNLYLWTHYVKEEFMLSTWDVIAENFGFMLVWGDLVLVPFLYCLPGWWVAADPEAWPDWAWMGLSAFYFVSLMVFRGANWQKERYKQDRDKAVIWGRPAQTIGGKLLVSGWWGIGRKINYTGEIGVYLAFAATAGFEDWGPFVLPAWLIVLLVQRAGRDDKKCRKKYGELWEAYCKKARFRIIPFVY